jgi:hypothetical protein
MRKEKLYDTRINYVAVRSPTGGNRSIVPVQYSLASLRRVGRVSRAAVRPMRLISPYDTFAVESAITTYSQLRLFKKNQATLRTRYPAPAYP